MRILIAEDDHVSRLKLESFLTKWDYRVIACENGEEAWKRIAREDSPSLVILDWMMPGLSGLDICRKIREMNREPYTYILLLTSRNQKEDIITGMEAGADDYITKPFYPHELKVRLRAGSRIVELNRKLFEAKNDLKRQATHDALTGLWNRPAIMDHLTAEMERSLREGKGQCAAIMDIDHFKNINDSYGHKAGDQVLEEMARRLASSLRPYDMIGRYGGEEFLIIIAGHNCAESRHHVERLRQCLADKPMETQSGPISVTASFGIAIQPPGKAVTPDALINAADQALYRAKANGRNRVELEILT